MALTHEEIVLDYWAHAFLDNPDLRKQHVTDDYEELMAAMEAEMAEMGTPQELLVQRMQENGQLPAEEPEGTAPATDKVTSGNVTVSVTSAA